MGEPMYRVGTGNYEYRLVLRCRQEARARFAKMRKDVLEKIELLDQKHGLFSLCVCLPRRIILSINALSCNKWTEYLSKQSLFVCPLLMDIKAFPLGKNWVCQHCFHVEN